MIKLLLVLLTIRLANGKDDKSAKSYRVDFYTSSPTFSGLSSIPSPSPISPDQSEISNITSTILINPKPSIRPSTILTNPKPSIRPSRDSALNATESAISNTSVPFLEIDRENFTSSIQITEQDNEKNLTSVQQFNLTLNSTYTDDNRTTSSATNIPESSSNTDFIIALPDLIISLPLTGSQAPTEISNGTLQSTPGGLTESSGKKSDSSPSQVNIDPSAKTSQGWIIGFFLVFSLFSLSTITMVIHIFMKRRNRKKPGSFTSSSNSPEFKMVIREIVAKSTDDESIDQSKNIEASIISEITQDFHDTNFNWPIKIGRKKDNNKVNYFDPFTDEKSVSTTNNSYAFSVQPGGYAASSIGASSVFENVNISQIIPSMYAEDHCSVPTNSDFEDRWNESYQYDVSSQEQSKTSHSLQKPDISEMI